MTRMLYDFALLWFRGILWLVAPFHHKAAQMVRGRKGWKSKIDRSFNGLNHEVVWFHCASLGEFEQGRPLIERYHQAFPEHKIFLTFYSPSGYEVRKDYSLAHAVHYLPWDTASNARILYQLVKPVAIFIIKYEYWFHLIQEGYRQNIPVIVCSAIFRKKQIFFKWYGGLFRTMLKQLDHIFVQDSPSIELLKDIGILSVTVCGDTRVDRVVAITQEAVTNSKVEKFANDTEVFIIGSSWPEDIEVLAGLINNQHDIKFIIAPHEVSESQIARLESVIKRPTARYSTFYGSNPEVLIIDTIGILSHLYRYGKYAYIGGAFGKGLHNILEAATFGLPLFFGNKNFQKFAEAKALVASGGAYVIRNSEELDQVYLSLKENRSKWQAAQLACLKYIRKNTGATEIIINYIKTRIAS